jgi:hypothetical protein
MIEIAVQAAAATVHYNDGTKKLFLEACNKFEAYERMVDMDFSPEDDPQAALINLRVCVLPKS